MSWYEEVGPSRRPPRRLASVAFALFMTIVVVWGSWGEGNPTQPADQETPGHLAPVPVWWAYGIVAVAALALIWRRSHPVAVLMVSTVAVLAYTALGYVNGAALLAPAAALYTVASRVSVRRALLAGVAVLVPLLIATAWANPFGTFGGTFIPLPWVMAAASFAGIAVANRRSYVDAIRQRADEAERSREEEARRRVDAERLRIARELHDAVAHTMATINVQAGVAAHLSPDLPPQVAGALQAIKESSKNGLRELRAILNVLRQVDDTDTTTPTPGLGDLPALVAGVNAAGMPTTWHTEGARTALPPAVDLAAYRIVQESLTNALRHAGPATADVYLGYGDHELSLVVTDTGHGPRAVAGNESTTVGAGTGHRGHGLIGMRERANAAGGTLQSGPGPGGGFRVSARLPLDPS